jgi:hypothetical protein
MLGWLERNREEQVVAYMKIIVQEFMQRNCTRPGTTSARITHAMTDIRSRILHNVSLCIEVLTFASLVSYSYPE